MPLYDYLTPKLDFKRKFNHRQSFLSFPESEVRFEIESNRISKLRRSLTHTPGSWQLDAFNYTAYNLILRQITWHQRYRPEADGPTR